jgi:hypothetical protein
VQSCGKFFDIEEVIMDASFLNKCALGVGDKVVHERSKPIGKHFLDDLGNGVNQANRPEVGDVFGAVLLRQQSDICGI